MEKLCPDAWYLNFTNPMIRLTWAITRYTKIRVAGICHQLYWAYAMAGALLADRWGLEYPPEFHVHTDHSNWKNLFKGIMDGYAHIDIKAAGINHFSWVYDIRDKQTGEDLYPLVRQRWLKEFRRDFEPLSRELFEIFGLMPTAGDSHAAEFLSWTGDPLTKPWKKYDLKLQSWDGNRQRRAERWELASAIVNGDQSVDVLKDAFSEGVPEIVEAITFNENYYMQQVNLQNNGLIPNLPADAIVEVPGVIAGYGIQGLGCPPLPEGIAELCRRELALSSLVIDAAVTGDRYMALQALLLDPLVTDIDQARDILNDFLFTFEEYLPQFA
jgi:alpha-galactosidase